MISVSRRSQCGRVCSAKNGRRAAFTGEGNDVGEFQSPQRHCVRSGVSCDACLLHSHCASSGLKFRQFQCATSPLRKNLVVWATVKAETNGRVEPEVFPKNNKIQSSHPAAS